jgi:hypothetical protein
VEGRARADARRPRCRSTGDTPRHTIRANTQQVVFEFVSVLILMGRYELTVTAPWLRDTSDFLTTLILDNDNDTGTRAGRRLAACCGRPSHAVQRSLPRARSAASTSTSCMSGKYFGKYLGIFHPPIGFGQGACSIRIWISCMPECIWASCAFR